MHSVNAGDRWNRDGLGRALERLRQAQFHGLNSASPTSQKNSLPMNLNDALRRALSDSEFALQPGISELALEDASRLRAWFESAHRRNELAISTQLADERLLALALWCHIDAQTISDMPPDIRARDLEFASNKFRVDIRALSRLITSTSSLFGGASQ